MQDPKQYYLFNELEYDDMESDDYQELLFDRLLNLLDEDYDYNSSED